MNFVTSKTFQEEVEESKLPVFLEFWSYDCKACEIAQEFLNELENCYIDKIKFVKINVEDERELSIKFDIKILPTFICFEGGKEKFRIKGFRSKFDIEKSIRRLI